MANRSRIFFFGFVLSPVALYFGAPMAMDHFDREGWRFFNTGKSIVTNLGSLAKSLQAKDMAGVESFYARDFSGSSLGLAKLEVAEEKDGVRKFLFRSDAASAGRDAALAEWRAYLGAFASIEEAGLHIHRIEKWDSINDVVASVRFELIGTLNGAPQ